MGRMLTGFAAVIFMVSTGFAHEDNNKVDAKDEPVSFMLVTDNNVVVHAKVSKEDAKKLEHVKSGDKVKLFRPLGDEDTSSKN